MKVDIKYSIEQFPCQIARILRAIFDLSSTQKIFYENFSIAFTPNYTCIQKNLKFSEILQKIGCDIIYSKASGEVGYEQRVRLLWTVYRGAPRGGH